MRLVSLSKVERVHMKKLYGSKVRSKSGITSEFKKILADTERGRQLLQELKKAKRRIKVIQSKASGLESNQFDDPSALRQLLTQSKI